MFGTKPDFPSTSLRRDRRSSGISSRDGTSNMLPTLTPGQAGGSADFAQRHVHRRGPGHAVRAGLVVCHLGQAAVGQRDGAAGPVPGPPDHVTLDLDPRAVHVAEAVVEGGAVRRAVNADDLDATDGRLADLPEGRVHDEEPAGCPFVDITGADRDRWGLPGP